MVVIIYFGRVFCGYDGIVYGGFFVIVMDEMFGCNVFFNFLFCIGVIVNLNINYCFFCMVD